LNKKRCW